MSYVNGQHYATEKRDGKTYIVKPTDNPEAYETIEDVQLDVHMLQRNVRCVQGWHAVVDELIKYPHLSKSELCSNVEQTDVDDDVPCYLLCVSCGTIHSDEGQGKCCIVTCETCGKGIEWRGHGEWWKRVCSKMHE